MSDIYTAPSNTTFFPKTTGLVFGPRLIARADKGRVFGLDVSPPLSPKVTIVTQPQDVAVVSMVRNTVTCSATGNYTVGYTWQMKKPDNSWSGLSTTKMNQHYPDATFPLIDVQGGTLNITWLQGVGPTEFRVRVSDTSESASAQTNSRVFILTYP
jgi:hypothetical protein